MTATSKPIPSGAFTYNQESRAFVAFDSDLYYLHPFAVEGRLQGIDIKSDRTGAVQHFVFDHTAYDNEGEIISWVFHNAETNTKLVIYND